MKKSLCKLLFLALILQISYSQVLDPNKLKKYMFTEEISGDLNPLLPSKLGYSKLWPLPIQTYQIAAMRAKHQFLPKGFPPTEIFAYAGKVGDKFIPSFPGPSFFSFKNMPIYVIWNNNIEGKHLFPIDYSTPFEMLADLRDEVPTVPHAHGLETQMGSDGQPLGYWTKSGKKGKDFFSLSSKNLKQNQAIFRYHNTKEGLLWFHDHTMGMTRLNVYAGLVGFYEIIDPNISSQQKNILKFIGDAQRKYFAIIDKTFNIDGSLFYPSSTQSQGYTSWVPEFFGNTITVNGKVWPKITLEPKLYRFVFLNGCQSRFLRISFQNNGQQLQFKIFRRDSDYLKRPTALCEFTLLIGGRVQILIDLSNVSGQILLKNSAVTPSPMGEAPDQYTSKILKIFVKNSNRNLQQTPLKNNIKGSNIEILPQTSTSPCTLVNLIEDRFAFYQQKSYDIGQQKSMDYIDINQARNSNQGNATKNKQISINDFKQSNDVSNGQFIKWANMQSNGMDAVTLTQINLEDQRKFLDQITKTLTVNPVYNSGYFSKLKQKNMNNSITNVPYPRFSTGTPYFTILNQVLGTNGNPMAIKIDDVGLKIGCTGATFKQSETYDFYIINLTMDDHPIHIHLVNFQVIGRFKFDIVKYTNAWKLKNGQFLGHKRQKMPDQVDVRPFKNSPIQPPLEQQKQFLDVIMVPSKYVTIARVKFSNHLGQSFPFSIKGARYVWHCHILEHQDNEMMRYFCVQ